MKKYIDMKFDKGDFVEFKNKDSKNGLPHDGTYMILFNCKMKNPSNGKWEASYGYSNINDSEIFIRNCKDMDNKFIKVRDLF